MVFDSVSDEDILREIQKIPKSSSKDEADWSCFDEIYRRYYNHAYNLARFYGLERCDAEDVVQDSFLKLLLRVQQFRAELCFRTWFMRIVFNTIRDKFREKKRRVYSDIEDVADTLPSDKAQNFLEKLHFQDESQRMINRIPEKPRMVFILRVYGEMEFGQIAQVLGISVRQAHNRMNQAVGILKKEGKGDV